MKHGNVIVAGVVPVEVKDFLLEQVKAGRFATVSKAVRYHLSLAARNEGVESHREEVLQKEVQSDDVPSGHLKQEKGIRTTVKKWLERRGQGNGGD